MNYSVVLLGGPGHGRRICWQNKPPKRIEFPVFTPVTMVYKNEYYEPYPPKTALYEYDGHDVRNESVLYYQFIR